MEVFSAAQSGLIQMPEEGLQAFQKLLMDFEGSWNFTELSDAMEFVRDDNNLVVFQGQREVRIFPSNGFTMNVNAENAVKSGVITKAQKDDCNKRLKFAFDSRGLTREQVMMLDIMANNDWKRGIGFSSPGGSEVSIALYRRGYIKQNGMIFELSPLANLDERYNTEKMYDNLMNNYSFGAMNNPKVLTDYYARRHTSQYRMHFLSLAEDYIGKAMSGEDNNQRIEMMKGMGNPNMVLPEAVDKKTIDGYRDRAKKLIQRSLEVMPAELVIDYGEPNPSNNPRDSYQINGKTLTGFSDGILHDYVGILYIAGDKEGAEKLGATVADQLESIISYYDKGNVAITARKTNTKDLYAALSAYFKMSSAANDTDFGNQDGKLAKRTQEKIAYLYTTMFPSMYDKLTALANANGESTRRGSNAGYYASLLFELQDYAEAMAIHYGWLDGAATPADAPTEEPSMEELLQMNDLQAPGN